VFSQSSFFSHRQLDSMGDRFHEIFQADSMDRNFSGTEFLK